MEPGDTLEARRTLALQQIAMTLQRILTELVALRVQQQKLVWSENDGEQNS